jgi:hypothetical protein
MKEQNVCRSPLSSVLKRATCKYSELRMSEEMTGKDAEREDG